MIELYKLDSDVLVGHNISGFDLDVLLHRAQVGTSFNPFFTKIFKHIHNIYFGVFITLGEFLVYLGAPYAFNKTKFSYKKK
jgi:hypothetical protein